MRSLLVIAVVGSVLVPGMAQSTGAPGVNDFTINGNGTGGTSCVASTLSGTNTFSVSGVPNCGVTFVYSPNCVPGSLALGPGTVDIDLSNFTVVIDGPGLLESNGLSGLGWADSNGTWTMSINSGAIALTPGGYFGAFQCAVLDPATGGIVPTQAHAATVGSCFASTAWVGVPDDGSLQVLLSSSVGFFGTSYLDVYVNSNGFVSLGVGDADFTDTEAEWLAGAPRFGVWEDFQPNALSSGPTTYGENNGVFTLAFDNCDNWASGGDTNTFCMSIELDNSPGLPGTVSITMLTMQLAAGNDGLPIVGITSGGGLSLPNSIDLSAVATTPFLPTNANDAIYEDFLLSGVFDLQSTTVTFTPSGLSGAGATTGPYIAN